MTQLRAMLLTAVLCLGIAACGSSDEGGSTGAGSGSATTATSSSEPVKLTFMAQINPVRTKEFWQGQVDRFTAKHPNVSVDIISPPDADVQKYLRQLIAGKDLPDVGFAVGVTPANKSYFTTWDVDDPEVQQIQHLRASELDGKLYQLGVDSQARNTVYYNMDLLEQAGVTEIPTTWDAFESTLAALKAEGIEPICGAGEWVTGRMFMGFNNIITDTPDWYAKRAAGEVKFDSQPWLDAAERFKGWADKGYFSKGSVGTPYEQANQNFLSGKCAIYQIGVWLNGIEKAAPVRFDVAVGAAPTDDGSVALTGGFGTANYAVFKDSKHPAEAEALARSLAFDPENHKEYIDLNGTSSDLKLLSGPLEFDTSTKLLKETQALVDNAKSFDVDYIGQGDLQPVDGIVDAINVMGQSLMSGGDPAAELKKLDELWDRNAR